MAESLTQLAISLFNVMVLMIFGRYLLHRFEELMRDVQQIKTDVAILKNERDIVNKVCPIRKEHIK